jgi:hypothetical protein
MRDMRGMRRDALLQMEILCILQETEKNGHKTHQYSEQAKVIELHWYEN